jgi:hypothetical protein
VKYRVKSQLYSDAEAQLKGAKQILDDCTWSSCAAAVSWASGYEVDYSAADGVAAMKKVTGRKDVQGKSDNGGSLAEAVKVIAHLGGKARYAKSWEDAVTAAKAGAALMVWVQQPIGYPPEIRISAWHDRWVKWWTKNAPEKIKAGYGHMTSAGYDDGWQWACPTRDEKVAAERYGVPVTEEQLRQIANSKFKAKKAGVDYKCLLIVTYPKKAAAPAPAPVAMPAPVAVPEPVAAPVNAGARVAVAAAPEVAPEPTRGVQLPAASTTPEPKKKSAVDVQLEALGKVDFGAVAGRALNAAKGAAAAAAKVKGVPAKMIAFLKYFNESTGIVSALTEFVRTFVTVSISVALGLGIPLLDISGGDFRTVLSAGLASGLGVLVKWLDPKQSDFGIKQKN